MVPAIASCRRAVTVLDKEHWWLRAKTSEIVIAGVAFAGVIFGLLGLDRLPLLKGAEHPVVIAVDLLVAVLCGGLIVKVVRDARARHQKIIQRLEIIAEMNHHIRNALDAIELSAHTTRDKQLIENLHRSVWRIEWALREVLPQDLEDSKSARR